MVPGPERRTEQIGCHYEEKETGVPGNVYQYGAKYNQVCIFVVTNFLQYSLLLWTVSADSAELVLGSGDICLHCFLINLFKKQSAKCVQNPSSFTKVMAKHI